MDDTAIEDLFSPLGAVRIRKMFGGKGIYHDGRIIAVEVDGDIMLKADRESASRFLAAGATQWRYDGKNAPVAMPYWTIPDAALDDPDDMRRWLIEADGAARRCEVAAVRPGKARHR